MAYDPEYHRNYYQANKEKIRETHKLWAEKNKEKLKQLSREKARIKRIQDPEYFRKSSRKYEASNPEKVLLRAARNRARLKNLEFSIDLSDIKIPEFCPLLEFKLEYKRGHGHGPWDFSPTLDRIDSNFGYIKGNVWVISSLANRIKSDGTPEQIMMLAKNLSKIVGIKNAPVE